MITMIIYPSAFSARVVNIWNRLPASVVQAPTINNFKKRLDDWSTDVDF